MNLQSACEVLEDLSESDAYRKRSKLSTKEFMALQQVLLELQMSGKYKLPEKYKGGNP